MRNFNSEMSGHRERIEWSRCAFRGLLSLIITVSLSSRHVAVAQSLSIPELIDGFCVSETEANDIKINCKHNQIIGIHEAYLTTSLGGSRVCPFLEPRPQAKNYAGDANLSYLRPSPCSEDLRLSMNRRCSGLSNCTFSLKDDHPSHCLGMGYVVVRYICVPEQRFQQYCSLVLKGQFGYIATPGYPDYYPPLDNCSWTIEGGEGQVVQVHVLDAHIREPKSDGKASRLSRKRMDKSKCDDTLIISEGSNRLLTVCGENVSNLLHVRSKGNKLNIFFDAHQFSPTRGVLLRYSLQGCPTLPGPKKGHLIYRNESTAVYSCCKDHVFEDTHEVGRVLYCVHGMEWNSTVSKCIDVVAPVVLMVTLLAGNAVIVYILVRLRRKQKIREQNETGIPLTRPPTVV